MSKCKCCNEKIDKDSEDSRYIGINWFKDVEHAIMYAKRINALKLFRANNKAQKDKTKANAKQKREFYANDVSFRKKAAQKAFNAYIRSRDREEPCISCDKPDNGQHQRHASHYRSVGACSQLRFNEENVHASCAQCNGVKSGNITEYRIRLIKKIGVENVEWLECQNEITRYSCEELLGIENTYKSKLKELMV